VVSDSSYRIEGRAVERQPPIIRRTASASRSDQTPGRSVAPASPSVQPVPRREIGDRSFQQGPGRDGRFKQAPSGVAARLPGGTAAKASSCLVSRRALLA